MTFQQNKFLKLLNAITANSEQEFFYDDECKSVVLVDSDRKVDASAFSSQINGILLILRKRNHRIITTFGIDYTNYRLTYKGMHHYYFSFETVLEFLVKSVIIPIVVALITAVLVS
ncbi:MAG: hypothetical protein ACLSXA_18035 [[Clostridium] scindens]